MGIHVEAGQSSILEVEEVGWGEGGGHGTRSTFITEHIKTGLIGRFVTPFLLTDPQKYADPRENFIYISTIWVFFNKTKIITKFLISGNIDSTKKVDLILEMLWLLF